MRDPRKSSRTSMVPCTPLLRAFTSIELLAAIAILAVLLVGCENPQQDKRSATRPANNQTSILYSSPLFRDDQFDSAHWDMSAGEIRNKLPLREQLIAFQRRSTNSADQADLDVSLGLLYSQDTGFVNLSNAVIYFTKTLQYDLPQKEYIEVVLWRGNCEETLHEQDRALMDYLRGLLACSYYDLSREWPEIGPPAVPIYTGFGSSNRENVQRIKDYQLYRRHLDFQQFVLMQRYYLIDAVKRIRERKTDSQIQKMIQELTPAASSSSKIMEWLKSENKRPWP